MSKGAVLIRTEAKYWYIILLYTNNVWVDRVDISVTNVMSTPFGVS